MIFWIREVIGWVLIALGLFGFGITYFDLLKSGKIVHAIPLTFISFIIFRGGIHLVKVAVAIRLSRDGLEETVRKSRNPVPTKIVTERKSVIPGAPASRN